MTRIILAALFGGSALALAACEDDPSNEMENAAEEVSEGDIEDAGDELEEAGDEAADSVEDELEDDPG